MPDEAVFCLPMPLLVTTVDHASPAWAGVRHVRQVVFVEGQNCPPEEEWDQWDAAAHHLLGTAEGAPVATARWRKVGGVAKLERFAVLDAHRGHGYGRQMVEAALVDARAHGFSRFAMNAQAYLQRFYEGFGFSVVGEPFDEVGIPHVKMVRNDAG